MAGGTDPDFRFVGSGSAGLGNPVTDRDLWLGGDFSSTFLADDHRTTTLTQDSTTRRHLIADVAPAGATADRELIGAWVLIRTGNASGHVSRIENYRQSDRRILMTTPAPANITSGDFFNVYIPGSMFPNVGADESVEMATQYRAIFLNKGGIDLRPRFYSAAFGGGESILVGAGGFGFNTVFTIDDINDPPIDVFGKWKGTTGIASGQTQEFGLTYGAGNVIAARGSNFNGQMPVYVGRLPANRVQRRSASMAIGLFANDVSTHPNEVAGDLIVWDVEGFDASVSYSFARHLFIKGGARGECLLQQGTQPVEGVPLKFGVIGQGSQVAPDDPATDYGISDAVGRAANAYFAPTDPAAAGEIVSGYAALSRAPAVGDPGVITPAAAATITFGGSATVTIL